MFDLIIPVMKIYWATAKVQKNGMVMHGHIPMLREPMFTELNMLLSHHISDGRNGIPATLKATYPDMLPGSS